jgi:hypothetical protein
MKKDYKITNHELLVGRYFEKDGVKYQILDYNKINNIFVYSIEDTNVDNKPSKTYSSIKPMDLLILMSREK